jgi:hypothetical protein
MLDGANLAAEDVAAPYSVSLDTSQLVDGAHTVSAVARDSGGRLGTAPAVSFTTSNGVVRLTPQDTSIDLDATNHSSSPQLTTYTWPSQEVANAILMKFDLSSIPAGATIQSAVLRLALISSDATSDTTYTITANKIQNKNPVITAATGYTTDGTTAWTANACCSGNIPLAQADISTPFDAEAIDKTSGYKSWTMTSLVQEWVSSPSTNFGVLLNSDTSKGADRFRYFASTKNSDPTLRPYLQIAYAAGVVDTTPPVLSLIAATSIGTSAATITWTSNEVSDSQVDYGTTSSYGTTTSLAATLVTAHSVLLSGLSAGTVYHFRVRSRDAAGNLALSNDSTFTTLAGGASPWPHEPSGFVPYTDWGVAALSGSGWNTVNSNGYASIVSDATAGVSAPLVGQWMYPTGFGGGTAPATMYHPLPAAFNEGFVGVEWKASNPWQGHSTYVNKIYFLLGGSCGNLIPIMYGPPGGPYDLRVAPEWGSWSFLTPNMNNVPVALGTWHKIEMYFKYNTAGAGIVRWWMDGTLIGDYSNVTFPASGCFSEFQFSPTWGGVGDTKSETDYFWFDHAHISVPGSTTPAASDNVGVADVQFKLDGGNVGAEDTVLRE